MRKKVDLTGVKFGRLTVLSEAGKTAYNQQKWNCVCDCGNKITAIGYNLKNGNTKSCGCLQKEIAINKHYKHGKTKSRLFYIWVHMKQRCTNPKERHFQNYGGRGITVCEEWQSDFMPFYEWAISHGYSDDLTLDRIDVNGNYEPSNCRWATCKEQQRNKRNNVRVSFDGKIKTIGEWAEEFNCFPSVVYREILKKEGRIHNEIN